MMFDYSKAIFQALVDYAKRGYPLGHFLTAVVENNLKEAICRADSDNLAGIYDLVIFVLNELPAGCQGSPAKVKAWRESFEAVTQ
jgi:hypothetical protein